MKTTTLMAMSVIGLAAMSGGALASTSTDTMLPRHAARHPVHHAMHMHPTMHREAAHRQMAMSSTSGAPRREVLANRDSTQAATQTTANLVIPGSDTALYYYGPDKNRQYGY